MATPVDVTGATEIRLKERDIQTTAPFRNVGVELSAARLNLTKGEKTSLTVNVSGLDGIKRDIPLQLVTTGTVTMQGGNTQSLQIFPNQIQPNGNYSQNFEITGIQAGVFGVTATVVTPGTPPSPAGSMPLSSPVLSPIPNRITAPPPTPPPPPPPGTCACTCEFFDSEIVSTGANRGKDNTYYFEPLIKTNCAGIDIECKVKNVSYEWNVGAAGTSSNVGYAVKNPIDPLNKTRRLGVNVTRSGAIEISVKVTATCSDGKTCTATATRTFNVTAPKRYEVFRNPPGKATLNCKATCTKPGINVIDKRNAVGGGIEYSFRASDNSASCAEPCGLQDVSYEWTVNQGSPATFYSIRAGTDKNQTLVVDVTGAGKLDLTVTVSARCNNGATCKATTTAAIFDVNPECDCTIKFADPPVIKVGYPEPSGGYIQHSFEPSYTKNECVGNHPQPEGFTYDWSTWRIGSTFFPVYNVIPGTEHSKRVVLEVAFQGTIAIRPIVNFTCGGVTYREGSANAAGFTFP